MPVSELDKAVSGFRRALLARERGASSEMVRVYGNSWKRLQGDIDRITKELTRVAPDDRMRLILQLQRARELRAQTEQELKKFADYASARIRYQQEKAISAASREAGEMIRAAVGVGFDFNRLPKSAIESLLGAIQAGSPVHERLMALAGVTASQVEDSLLQGLMLGQGANQIARNIRKALGLGLSKALVWSRTETLRAYRSASIETYRANGNVVESWIWRSARNERTCAACFAMDGTVHSLNEPLDDHPCGRCFAVPKVFGAEVGSTGREAFDKLPSAEQLKILGPSKYAAYKDGAITLDEDPITGVVGRKWDPQWGTMRYERSLSNMGIDSKYWLQKYQGNPIESTLTVDQLSELTIKIHSENSGSTVSMLYGNLVNKPFHSVSIFPDIGIQIPGKDLDKDIVTGFVRKYEGLLNNPKCVLGTWYNKEDGNSYLDISVLIRERDIAINLSKVYNQIGIFDLENMEYIPTGGSGLAPNNLKSLGKRLSDL